MSIAVALIAVFLIRSFLFTVIRVDGDSMKETLHNGERLIVTVLDVKLGGVNRDDVIICHFPGRTGFLGIEGLNFVKRVVGVAGDKIVMLSGETFSQRRQRVDEPFVTHPSPDRSTAPGRCPRAMCSSAATTGPTPTTAEVQRRGLSSRPSDIVGKVRLVIWPISAWRTIT